MNIFVLDMVPSVCAEYHCDKHVTKMILEYAQILCTSCNYYGEQSPYKSFNPKHPCNLWAISSRSNWLWLKDLSFHLNQEWKLRFNHTRNHNSYNIIQCLECPELIPRTVGLTPFPLCMPEQYKCSDPVQSYRNFYNHEKSRFAKWSLRPQPSWYQNLYIKDKNNAVV